MRVAILQETPSLKITQTLIKTGPFEGRHVNFVKSTQIPSQTPYKTLAFTLLRTCEPRTQKTLQNLTFHGSVGEEGADDRLI